MLEVKTLWQSEDGLVGRQDVAEDRIFDLESMTIETSGREEQKKKKDWKKEKPGQNIQETVGQLQKVICRGITEGEERQKGGTETSLKK